MLLSKSAPGTNPASLQQTVPGLENNARAAVCCPADIHQPPPGLCVLRFVSGGLGMLAQNPQHCIIFGIPFRKGFQFIDPQDTGLQQGHAVGVNVLRGGDGVRLDLRPQLCRQFVPDFIKGGPNPLCCALKDNFSFAKGRRTFGPVDVGISPEIFVFLVFGVFNPFFRRFYGVIDFHVLLSRGLKGRIQFLGILCILAHGFRSPSMIISCAEKRRFLRP